MNSSIIALYWLISAAGFVMVIGGMLLIWKEKIFIDRETKQVIGFKLPLLGEFKTNIPALALFVIGFAPMVYTINALTDSYERVTVQGSIRAIQPPANIDIFAVEESVPVRNIGDEARNFRIAVLRPKNGTLEHHLLFLVNNRLEVYEPIPRTPVRDGVIPLPRPIEVSIPPPASAYASTGGPGLDLQPDPPPVLYARTNVPVPEEYAAHP